MNTALESAEALLFSTLSDDKRFAGLIADYVTAMPESITALETGLAHGDTTLLQRQAHRLKGSAGTYGFASISVAAASLESALRDRDSAAIPVLAKNVVSLCRRISSKNS